MLFSSITFIYFFLPILLITYFVIPKKFKNFTLLAFSLLFYFLGEPKYIIILLLSCVINYYISKGMEKNIEQKKLLLWIAVIYNVGQLIFFKYMDFFITNVNKALGVSIPLLYLIMPIGISFFTFQALAYVIDVYNGKHKPARNLLDFMTYITLFPQLIAGPIVRFADVKEDLEKRTHSFAKVSEGIKRFTIGLSKKVLLANVLGEVAKNIIEESVLASWMKPILYTLQIYFDFSGYSDMAIGLGLMFGFRFLENFNYPLIAKSITDFWRRWHMSLSRWFRDYVYIPLGGNRVGRLKFIRNIFIVWFLTGFWHGADWNFIIWGLYFGVLLVIEKFLLGKYIEKTKVIKYIYTIVIVVVSFLIFSETSFANILHELGNMFGINKVVFAGKESIYYLKNNLVLLIISIIAATPLMKNVVNKLKEKKVGKIINVLEPIVTLGLLVVCTAFLIDESFNPFLYFRF